MNEDFSIQWYGMKKYIQIRILKKVHFKHEWANTDIK